MKTSTGHEERGRFIRAVIAWHNVNQTQLGELLGCTQQAAGQKLAGNRKFTVDELDLIAETYGVDPGVVLRPAERAAELLGRPASTSGSESAWTARVAGQRRFLAVAA